MKESFLVLEDLNVWIKCRELKNKLAKVARELPAEEKYRLTDQLIRHQDLLQIILQKVMEDFIFRKIFSS